MAAVAANEEVEILETWEEMEDSGELDRKLQSLKMPSSNESDIHRTVCDRNANKEVIIMGEDAFRTQYVPPEPTVKILKRPTQSPQGAGDGPLLNGDKPTKQPMKTLKQREQEYAKARLRILGEARSPEEPTEDKVNKIQNKIEVLRPPETDCIIRLPRGPDGTRGFNVRR